VLRKNLTLTNYPPKKLQVVPQWSKEDSAFNFINKEFRKNRNAVKKMNNKYFNKSFTGNGARGHMKHDKEDLSKVTGYQKLRKEKPKKHININEEGLAEKREINYNGAELKGKRITLSSVGKAYIKENSKKWNRGGQGGGRRSGMFSGGLSMRWYEAHQIKKPSGDKQVVEKDEFSNLQNLIQKQQIPYNNIKNIKTDSLGI